MTILILNLLIEGNYIIRNHSLNIVRSHTVGVINFYHRLDLLDLITPTVFDNLIISKNGVLFVRYVYISKKGGVMFKCKYAHFPVALSEIKLRIDSVL